MVHTCYLCGKRQIKGQLEPMHRFPKKEQLRSLWKEACGLLENDDVSTLTICSRHFRPIDYVQHVASSCHLRLKRGVVPSVRVPNKIPLLNWADHFQSSINDPEVIEEIVETSYSNVDCNDDEEDVPLNPSNCKFIESHNWYEVVDFSNIDIDLMDQIIEISPEHEEHTYSAPFRDTDNENCHHLEPNSDNSNRESPSLRKRKFLEPRFVSEIELYDFTNPQIGKRTLKLIKTVNKTQQTKIQALRSKVARLQKRLAQLKEIETREKSKNDNNLLNVLPENIKDILIKKMKTGRYPDELKEFALKLYSYSPKAYVFVRKFWKNLLPHPATLREWHREIDKSEMKTDTLAAVIEEVINSDDIDAKHEIIIDYEEVQFEGL